MVFSLPSLSAAAAASPRSLFFSRLPVHTAAPRGVIGTRRTSARAERIIICAHNEFSMRGEMHSRRVTEARVRNGRSVGFSGFMAQGFVGN